VVCDCFEKADKALREQHGAGIGWSVHAPTAGAVEFRPTITTYVDDTARPRPKRGARVPDFCPFCGQPYDAEKHHAAIARMDLAALMLQIDADPDVRIGFFGGADGADYMERLRAILDRLEKSGV
jgi:hypothetical protein